MTLEEIYDMVRTDDFMQPRKSGAHAHPYSEAAERVTKPVTIYEPTHVKTTAEIRADQEARA